MTVHQWIGITGLFALAIAAPRPVLATELVWPADKTERPEAARMEKPPAPATGRAPTSEQTQPDFLFGQPDFTLGVRGEAILARADSNIFEFTEGLLTLKDSDFNAPGFVIDLGVPLTSRLNVQAGFEFSRSSEASHYRDFTDADGFEIEQSTSLVQINLFGNIKLALLRRGRAIGQYAWTPAVVSPYVGVGAGFLWYQFEQKGDFVDFVDNSIFQALLQSQSWTPSAHMFTGVDIKITRRILATGELRYQWADTSMTGDYAGPFQENDFLIDLTGLRITGGVQFLF